MGLAYRLDGGSPRHGAAVPEEHDRAPQMLQQRPQEGDIKGLEVTRLEADIAPQVLALGRYRESGQRRDTVMSITVRDNGRVPLGSPRLAAWGDEQKATLIQKGEVGPQAASFFYGGPSVALPMRTGLFVTLNRQERQHLTAPAQAAQDLPDVRRVIVYPKVHLNHRRNAP
jgi:hypothetical protein